MNVEFDFDHEDEALTLMSDACAPDRRRTAGARPARAPLLVGPDDETWDLALILPVSLVAEPLSDAGRPVRRCWPMPSRWPMPSPLLPALKARLDRLLATPDLDDRDLTPEHLQAFDEASRAFLAAGPDLLDQATEHLWAYYRDTAGEYSPADWEVHGIPALDHEADIWAHVTITNAPALTPGGTALEPGRAYISFEGEVTWEDEHGLQLVFEDGRAVCKVGPYDGHVTNAHAHGDEALLGTVYK